MNAPVSDSSRLPFAFHSWRTAGVAGIMFFCTACLSQAASTPRAWGANALLQCQAPSDLTNLIAIAAGKSHSLALKADGTVVGWGGNLAGQASVPAGLKDVVAIAAGGDYSLALKNDGTVVGWGSQPAPPASLTNVQTIAAGWTHSLALRRDGTVVAWGNQMALPANLTGVTAIAAGNGQSLALRADGSVVAWGDDSFGKTKVPLAATNIVAIAAGGDHCLALQQGGKVIAWGRNDYAQATVPPNLQASAIAGGALHSVALRTDGTLVAWGDNTYNQIGATPADNGYANVTAGDNHNLAIKGDGSPLIITQPASQIAAFSKTASFRVIVGGTPPFTYWWYHDSAWLSEASGPTLTLTNLQPSDSGIYTVHIFNRFGWAGSTPAVLTVVGAGVPPAFSSTPQSQTNICGETVAFQAAAEGSAPLSYQWHFQGLPIPGATQTSLVFTNITAAQAGEYSILVTNAFGSCTTGAVLTVTVVPPVITSPLALYATQGQAFRYTLQALHSPMSYSAIFLPSGLDLDPTNGIIAGTPLESGLFSPIVTCFNSCTSDTELFTFTIAPAIPVITSSTNASGSEGAPFNYQIKASNSPNWFGARDLPVGLLVDPNSGLISGTTPYPGTFHSVLLASNVWGIGTADVWFTFGNSVITNLFVGNLSYNYSTPYLLDFQFSLYSLADTNDPTSVQPLVVDPTLLSATCLEDDTPISPSETGSFIVQGRNKVLKYYLVLDFTESIASAANGDTNLNGISDAVDFMVDGAKDFVDQQAFDTQIGVYEFHREDMAPSNVVTFTIDKELLHSSIDGIWTNYVRGFSAGSRVWDALMATINEFGTNNPDEEHNIVLVSDGQDDSSLNSATNVISAATNAGVKIFCVGFGPELNANSLQNLALQTQGSYYTARTPADLAARFAQVAKSARGQYILRWATLRRSTDPFMPSFHISYAGLGADSPTNPVTQDFNNPIIDTNATPPTTNYPLVTNFIIAYYYPSSNAGPVTVGNLRIVPDAEVRPTGMNLRATYVPRDIGQLRFHYRPNWPCTASLQSTNPGEMLFGWSMTETNDEAGGKWLLLNSPIPDLGMPFASFGKLVTFTFKDLFNPSNAFSFFDVDNTLYTNAGGQEFVFADTNSYLRQFPVLPYGTPVPWLMSYGYTANFTNAELLDPDNDGLPNWQEYRANTQPKSAASVFIVRTVTRQPDGRFQLRFSTALNRTYQVQGSLDLLNWQVVQDNITGVGQDMTITDTRFLPGVSNIFYRVLVY